MTARSTSNSRASCCCPCGLASAVTVAAGTNWGDATPCYASHMMLVLLYGYEKKDFFHGLYGYENKEFFHCRINTQTIIKFPDKLIGKGCPTTAAVLRVCLNFIRPSWNGWNGTRLFVVVRSIPTCFQVFVSIPTTKRKSWNS